MSSHLGFREARETYFRKTLGARLLAVVSSRAPKNKSKHPVPIWKNKQSAENLRFSRFHGVITLISGLKPLSIVIMVIMMIIVFNIDQTFAQVQFSPYCLLHK